MSIQPNGLVRLSYPISLLALETPHKTVLPDPRDSGVPLDAVASGYLESLLDTVTVTELIAETLYVDGVTRLYVAIVEVTHER